MVEWIEISNQLPKHNQTVLLHFEDGEIAIGCLKIYDGKVTEAIKGSVVCKYKEATYWMPLPQPPQESK